MIKSVLAIDRKGQVVPVRRRGVQRPTSGLITAQASAAQAAASAATALATAATRTTAPTRYPRAKSNHLANAQVQAHICRPGAEIVRDDFFAPASGAGERIGIKTAVGRRDSIRLAATQRKRRTSVELVITGQVTARRDVVGRPGIGGEKRRE